MSRKIYIYNRAALLYKRGASLRNWKCKKFDSTEQHSISQGLPQKCCSPAFSLLSKPHKFFVETSNFLFCGNLTIFCHWREREEKPVFCHQGDFDEWFKVWCKISKAFGVMSKGTQTFRFMRGQSRQTATHERSESIRKKVTNQRNRTILHDIIIRHFRSKSAQRSSSVGWIAILLFFLPMTDTKDEEIVILVGLI